MDLTLACSAQEQESFARLCPTGQCDVIPNGVDISYFTPGKDDEEQPGVVVFTGAMGYWPNEQAAIYFCQEVLPVFRGKYSSTIKVYFVGKAPSSRVQSLHNGDNVIVTGEVSDVRPYLRAAQVVIVPLQHGAGTRLKILEAFAMGKAVVSTSLGVEGISATHEREILIADTPEIFAAQVTRLLQVESLRHRLGHSARRFVTEHFSWPSIQQRLLGAYQDLPMRHKHLCYA
jgi:glycosyltransferase involved in cell wall biosynthesis